MKIQRLLAAPFPLLLGMISLSLSFNLHASTKVNSCVADFSVPAKPLNLYFLGANTSFFNRPYNFTNPEVIRLTKGLNLQTLRFPAGSPPSNFFDWKTGTFYSPEILTLRLPAGSLKSSLQTATLATMAKYHPTLKVDDMVAYSRTAGATPIWVANFLSGTPKEEGEWVAYNKKENYPNQFWELGNEMYLTPFRAKYPTVQDYIKASRDYTTAMKVADPSIMVAIDAAAMRFFSPKMDKVDGEWVQNSGKEGWNEALAKESFYDAVVVHDYFVINKEVLGKSEDEVHRYLMAHPPAMIKYYTGLFGKNVQLWMTEWNIMPYFEFVEKKNPDQFPADFVPSHYWLARTVDHALYVADWYLEALRFPENIKITDLHVLAAQGYWGLFQLPAPEKDHTDKAFLINSPYYAVSWVGDALKRSDSYKFAKMEGEPELQGGIVYSNTTFPGVVAGAFYQGETITSVLLINKTLVPQNVSFKGIGTATPKGATSHCLTGAGPLEGWGKDKPVKDEDTWRPQINITTSTVSGGRVKLPPASLTYVVFQKP